MKELFPGGLEPRTARTAQRDSSFVSRIVCKTGNFPVAIQEDFEMIGRNARMQARLITDLLDLTRISRGKNGDRMPSAQSSRTDHRSRSLVSILQI